MAEVFISYARTDQGFARDLSAALQKLQRDTWIDWRSIPDSAQWRAEIFAAIEAADNFLFIVSPDSLRSWMCGQEVAHAVANKKRIVTILYHPVTYDELLPGLKEIQWINYPELGFEQTFQRLMIAIDTDLDWVRQHTRFGLRAVQWEASNRDTGFLLHGMELRDAVRWLEQAPTIKSRQPTQVHEQYIRASEDWEAGEIKRLTELTEEKKRQRQEAERLSRIAVARELVTTSIVSLEEDPERSIILAMHAMVATLSISGIGIPEAEDALHRAILRSPIRHTLEGHPGMVCGLALSGDGQRAISAVGGRGLRESVYADITVELWDVQFGRKLRTLAFTLGPFSRSSPQGEGIALSGDGGRAIYACPDETLKVWELPSGRELQTLKGHTGAVLAVAMSRDGRLAVSASIDDTLKVWDVESGRKLRTLKGHSSMVSGVALSRDGRLAVSASEDETVKVWDVETGRELRTMKGHPTWVREVALSSDGQRAVSACQFHNVKVWDVESGTELRTLEGSLYGIALSGDGRVALSAVKVEHTEKGDHRLKVWDVESGRLLWTLKGHSSVVYGTAMSEDGRLAISASYRNVLKVWELGSGRELRTLRGHTGSVNAVAVTPDGQHVLSASWQEVKLWDLESGRELRTLEGRAPVAVSRDGRLAVSAWGDHRLKVWQVESGRELHPFSSDPGFVQSLALTPDGQRVIAASRDGALKIWDLRSGCELRTLKGHKGSVSALGVTPDGQRVVAASWKELNVWELESGRELCRLHHSEFVMNMAIGGDGRLVVSASADRTLRVWDLELARELRILRGHSSYVYGVAVSPNGRRLASGSYDKTVRIWDMDSGGELIVLAAHSNAVRQLAWTPDGRRLLSAGDDGIIQVYAMDVDLLMSLARSRVTRNLTSEECRKYLHRDDVPPIP